MFLTPCIGLIGGINQALLVTPTPPKKKNHFRGKVVDAIISGKKLKTGNENLRTKREKKGQTVKTVIDLLYIQCK